MIESITNGALQYKKLSPDEMKSHGILGRLVGPCCDTINPTRNGRLYSEELWEKVFSSPLVVEQFKAGGIFGELTHPADREEVALEKVAISMPEPPKKNDDGLLIGVWDILDTPCGRILKTLCDYGYTVGISTRGTGDITTDYDGNECVDPDTYTLNAMDIVTIPAVKEARLQYVTESVDNKVSLSESLNKLIEKSNDDDKKIITETLDSLDIQYSADEAGTVNIDATADDSAAIDDGADVIRDLQQSLKEKKALEAQVAQLQEKLSVCYAKETELKEMTEKYKSAMFKLSSANKTAEALRKRVSSLTENLKAKETLLAEKDEAIEGLREGLDKATSSEASIKKNLSESVTQKDATIKKLQSQVKTLTESAKTAKAESDKECNALKESIEDMKKDSAIKRSEYSEKINKATKLTEKYKSIAKLAVDKYIDSQALKLGVKSVEIKNKLPEGYSFDDIDNICEELQSYKISLNKLPFDIAVGKKVRVAVTESKEPILPANRLDDEIDSSLQFLAGTK